MLYCRSDLTSRQNLQSISLRLRDIQKELLENAALDITLMCKDDYVDAMHSLNKAIKFVSDLRAFASPDYMSDLEMNVPDFQSFINRF